jgi:hypothetical protein
MFFAFSQWRNPLAEVLFKGKLMVIMRLTNPEFLTAALTRNRDQAVKV